MFEASRAKAVEKLNDFDLDSIRLNSHLSAIDSVPSGLVDIKADKGTYKNRSFDSGTVSAIIENKLIRIENCHFKSGKDYLQLSGTYNGEDSYSIDRLQLAYKDNYLINSGLINLFQSCVPFGNHCMTYSAPKIAYI